MEPPALPLTDPPMASSSPSLLPLLWFFVVLALIPLALWLFKRTPMGRQAAGMAPNGLQGLPKVIGILSLSQTHRLVTVEVGQGADRQWLVLGLTGQNITPVHVLAPQAELPTDLTAQALNFSQLLNKFKPIGKPPASSSIDKT
jgi:flagellar protein FliO/FliZ